MVKCSAIIVGLLFVIAGSYTQLRAQTESNQVQDETANLVAEARAFVDLLVKKNFAGAVAKFDDTVKAALPEPKLEETWNAVLAQAGAFKQVGKARTEKHGAYAFVFVTCDFQNGSLDVRVTYDRSKRIAELFFLPTNVDYSPPAYVKKDSFREQEVTVGTGEWALPGTLTVPVGASLFPALVLVHGSGPNDRDETLSANKPFKDLAWGLASNGIAVLRFEKRTRQHTAKVVSLSKFTVKEEVIDDALAAVELLRKTDGVDAKSIFVLGHSLGGMLVPRIGQSDPNIAGLISLAGATRPIEEVFPEQLAYIFSLDGSVSAEEQKQIDQVKELAAKVKTLKPEDANSATPIFGAPASYWLDLRGYDPTESAKALKQPLLFLQGERDYQVTMDDFKRWNAALAAKSNVTFKSYPALNHLFIAGIAKSSPAEYQQAGHVDERVIVDIAAWIKKHVGTRKVVVLGQEFANAQAAEELRKLKGVGGKSPMPAATYDVWHGELSLINPTKNAIDTELSGLTERFANSDKQAQAKMRTSISLDEFYTLLSFSRRSAVFALREKNAQWVKNGLMAIAMIEAERTDYRDIKMAISLLYHSGKGIGANADQLFRDTAKHAEPNVARLLTEFLQQSAETKDIRKSWGHDEVETAGGIGFIGWRFKEYRPTYDLKSIAVDIADVVARDKYQPTVDVADALPPIWLQAPENPSLQSVMKKVRAGATIHGELRPNEHPTYRSQVLMLFLVETEDASAAQDLLEMSRKKRPTSYSMVAVAEDRLFCLVIGRSFQQGVASFETQESLQRFSPVITEVLKRYSVKK